MERGGERKEEEEVWDEGREGGGRRRRRWVCNCVEKDASVSTLSLKPSVF